MPAVDGQSFPSLDANALNQVLLCAKVVIKEGGAKLIQTVEGEEVSFDDMVTKVYEVTRLLHRDTFEIALDRPANEQLREQRLERILSFELYRSFERLSKEHSCYKYWMADFYKECFVPFCCCFPCFYSTRLTFGKMVRIIGEHFPPSSCG